MQYMDGFAARLGGTGEFVDSSGALPRRAFVPLRWRGAAPVTDGPFAETKDLVAGWMVIDVETASGRSSWPANCPRLRVRVGSRSTSGSSAPLPGRAALTE